MKFVAASLASGACHAVWWCEQWLWRLVWRIGFFADPYGFNVKRRKTTEQSYSDFMTDMSHLPSTVSMFNCECSCRSRRAQCA